VSRIGITGHQGLKIEIETFVSRRMGEILEGEPNLIGITSLAAGADQLFAHMVLVLGGSIEVILPTPAYHETFSNLEDLAAYKSLLSQAVKTTILPFPRPNEEAFMAAGRAVVDQSNRLIAVWDGYPAHGLGGTADVVAYARQRGVPVVVIWPEGATRD